MFKPLPRNRKGRHRNPKTARQERLCKLRYDQVVEDEDHFLLKCTAYSHLWDHYQMNQDNVPDVLSIEDQYRLAKFLLSAYERIVLNIIKVEY